MLTIDREERRSAAGCGVNHERAGGYQGFLVRQCDSSTCLHCSHCRPQTRASNDRSNDEFGIARGGFNEGILACRCSAMRADEQFSQVGITTLISHNGKPGAGSAGNLR